MTKCHDPQVPYPNMSQRCRVQGLGLSPLPNSFNSRPTQYISAVRNSLYSRNCFSEAGQPSDPFRNWHGTPYDFTPAPNTRFSCKIYCWKKPRLEACSRQHGSFEDEQGIGVHKDKENGASIQVPTFVGYRA